jgi:ubiquitin-protein ligase
MTAPDIRTKRTSIEIEKVNKETPNHGISIHQNNKENLFKLEAILPGPKDSFYEKGKNEDTLFYLVHV